MYTIKAYPTTAYNQHETIHKDFKDLRKMWNWCKEYLSGGNRKVIVHRVDRKYSWGSWRNRRPEHVKKIGIFTRVEEIPSF